MSWIVLIVALVISVLTLIYNILAKRPYVFLPSIDIGKADSSELVLLFQLKNVGDMVAKDVQVYSKLLPLDTSSFIQQAGKLESSYKLKNKIGFKKIVLFPKIEHKLTFFTENNLDIENIMRLYNLIILVNYRRNKLWPPFKQYETVQIFEYSNDKYTEISSFIRLRKHRGMRNEK